MTGRGISNGPNSRSLDDTLAETGPGISDDAVLDGELGPDDLADGADAMIEGLREKGWTEEGEAATPPDDSEAHPS